MFGFTPVVRAMASFSHFSRYVAATGIFSIVACLSAPASAYPAINPDGTVSCEGDDDTTYTAGTGLTLNDRLFSVDTNAIQRRVGSSCAAGTPAPRSATAMRAERARRSRRRVVSFAPRDGFRVYVQAYAARPTVYVTVRARFHSWWETELEETFGTDADAERGIEAIVEEINQRRLK